MPRCTTLPSTLNERLNPVSLSDNHNTNPTSTTSCSKACTIPSILSYVSSPLPSLASSHSSVNWFWPGPGLLTGLVYVLRVLHHHLLFRDQRLRIRLLRTATETKPLQITGRLFVFQALSSRDYKRSKARYTGCNDDDVDLDARESQCQILFPQISENVRKWSGAVWELVQNSHDPKKRNIGCLSGYMLDSS